MSEELDLAQGLNHVNVLNREDFRLACMVTLVKRREHLDAFEEAFEEYWSAIAWSPWPRDEKLQSLEPIPHPAGDIRRALGGPTSDTGEDVDQREERVRIVTYSPDAPAGRREMTLVDRHQLEAMRRLARGFRRWSATLEGRRFVGSERGEMDFLRTARASLRFGGEWLVVRRRRRKLQRVRLLILWDVSGSMEGHGPLLLALIHSLLRAVPSAEVFAFSTDLRHVTSAIRGRPYRSVLRDISRTLSLARGGTRIGRCLEQFSSGYGGLVDDKTVVLILSDGWDVGDLDLLEKEMRSLRRACRLLVWVNPYADRPGFKPETAGMMRAMPHVDLLVPPTAFLRREEFRRHFSWAPPALNRWLARLSVDQRGMPTGEGLPA
jgi:uncharacterized protein with von Willebrand factor type A (vWA) domain